MIRAASLIVLLGGPLQPVSADDLRTRLQTEVAIWNDDGVMMEGPTIFHADGTTHLYARAVIPGRWVVRDGELCVVIAVESCSYVVADETGHLFFAPGPGPQPRDVVRGFSFVSVGEWDERSRRP